MKKKFKLKSSKNNFLDKLKAPFINRNNQIVFASFLVLLSLYLVIAFTSFFINWQADNSIVLDNSFSNIITNDEIKNSLGGLGAYLSHTLIYRLFGVSAYLIFMFTFLLGIRIFGFKKISVSNSLFHILIALIYVPVFIFHFYENSLLAGGLGINTQNLCKNAIGDIGTTLLLLTILLIYIPLSLNIKFQEVKTLFKVLISKIKKIKPKTKEQDLTNINKSIVAEELSSSQNNEKIVENKIEELEPEVAKDLQPQEKTIENNEEKSDEIAIEINKVDNEEKLKNHIKKTCK